MWPFLEKSHDCGDKHMSNKRGAKMRDRTSQPFFVSKFKEPDLVLYTKEEVPDEIGDSFRRRLARVKRDFSVPVCAAAGNSRSVGMGSRSSSSGRTSGNGHSGRCESGGGRRNRNSRSGVRNDVSNGRVDSGMRAHVAVEICRVRHHF